MAPAGPYLGPAVVARADGDRVVVAATTGVPGRREGVVGEVGAVHAVERAGRGVALELVRREPAAVEPLPDGRLGGRPVDLERQDAVHREAGRGCVDVVTLDRCGAVRAAGGGQRAGEGGVPADRKGTRLNSSH